MRNVKRYNKDIGSWESNTKERRKMERVIFCRYSSILTFVHEIFR